MIIGGLAGSQLAQLKAIEDKFYDQYFGKIVEIQRKREQQSQAQAELQTANANQRYPVGMNPFSPDDDQKPATGVPTVTHSGGALTTTGVPVGATQGNTTGAQPVDGVVREEKK